MKRFMVLVSLASILLTLSACGAGEMGVVDGTAGEEQESPYLSLNAEEFAVCNREFDNLNLSQMTVTVPDVDELSQVRLFYNGGRTVAQDIVARFLEKVAEQYPGESIEESSIYCALSQSVTDEYGTSYETEWYPYSEVKDDLEEQNLTFMKYEDSDHFFLFYIYAMTEWFDLPLVYNAIGLTDYSSFGWRPYDGEEFQLVATYSGEDLESEDISYPLLDGDMSLKDYSTMVEEQMQAGFCELSAFLPSKLTSVEVYEMGDGVYGYYGYSTKYFDGVPLENEPWLFATSSSDARFSEDMTPEDGLFHLYYCADDDTFAFNHQGLAWVWTSDTFDDYEVVATYQEVLPLETALEQVSAYLSDGVVLSISSAQLLYATEQIAESEEVYYAGGDYEVNLFPVWEFTVENPAVNGYTELRFVVDAITGTVTLCGME
jgi:hypothetical protein